MAEDGQDPRIHVQETFQRAPDTRAEHRFPGRLTGVVAVPPGSRGPRSLYLKRYGDSFGFTLRHFIVYPPESVTDCDVRRGDSGAGSGGAGTCGAGGPTRALQPMETIFVRQIADRGAAAVAGLQPGDQILSVNGISVRDIRSDNKYHEVVQIIKNAPEYLHLLVVPKEEDIIQKFYVHAHHPSSNQHSRQQLIQQQLIQDQQIQQLFYQQQQEHASAQAARHRRQSFATLNPHHRKTIDPPAFNQRSATLTYAGHNQHQHNQFVPARSQKSADHIYSEPVPQQHPLINRSQQQRLQNIRQQRSLESCLDSERFHTTNEGGGVGRQVSAAQAQEHIVVRRQTMGRRPSAANNTDRDSSTDYCSIAGSNEMMKATANDNMLVCTNAPDCRRSLDATGVIRRRESVSSISSSMTDASKHGSVNSVDSSSTITDRQDMDESAREKIKQRIQEREDFLNKGSGGNGVHYDNNDGVRHKEYYSRVSKLEKKQVWPPTAADLALQENQRHSQSSPSKFHKPTHQSVQRVKSDIDLERDLGEQKKNGKYVAHLDKINEIKNNDCNKSAVDDRRNYQLPTQIVQSKARAFETGRSSDDRTSYFTSELHRLTSKHAAPNVLDRTKEFESLGGSPPPPQQQTQMPPPFPLTTSNSGGVNDTNETRKDASWSSVGSTEGRKGVHGEQVQAQVHNQQYGRDSKSLDSSDFSLVDNEFGSYRARSNSADSWKALPNNSNAVGSDKPLVIRRTKNTNITDEDRIMRRESYLKATERERMNFEYDLSDGEVSPQVLRSGSISGNSSSSVSLEREKGVNTPLSEQHKQPIVKEGLLICKFTEYEGKRSGDRSWKQYWAMLRGPSLYLYKDRHHQSPVGSAEAQAAHTAAVEQSIGTEIGVRGSIVQVAADYTKRKNVLRLTSVMPCRQELLLQADTADDLHCWVRALQEQADGASGQAGGGQLREEENEITTPSHNTKHPQLAEPQITSKTSTTTAHLRNRSPTGLSPASKTRKPSATSSVSGFPGTVNSGGIYSGPGEPATSPKLKTWKGRVKDTFRKIHGGASSPNSPTAPENSTFGVPLEHCLPAHYNQHVPRLVEVCTDIVEAKALETVGIYRVPGKKADVTALTDEVNKNYDEVPQIDPRWNDVHVVSSLLKSFFRKIPESLLMNELYPDFIKADKQANPEDRMQHIRLLLRQLPAAHYHTLRHLILHLRRIVHHSDVNKMDAKNVAIVFGPTIVRSDDNMQTMVNDMTNQCKIVETLLTYTDWFFSDDDVESLHLPAPIASAEIFQTDPEGIRADLLRDTNINKIEGLHQTKEQKEKHRVIQTILSAAMKKKKKSIAAPSDIRLDTRISNGQSDFAQIQSYTNTYDLKENTTESNTNTNPTAVSNIEHSPQQQQSPQQPKSPGKGYFNYKKDTDQVKKRIENFIQETESNLTRPRNADLGSNNLDVRISNQHHPHSYSAGNISHPLTLHTNAPSPLQTNTNPRLSLTSTLPSLTSRQTIVKTNSASNVFGAQLQTRHQLPFTVAPKPYSGGVRDVGGDSVTDGRFVEYGGGLRAVGPALLRRGSSVENITADSGQMHGVGVMKKTRYEAENEAIQRSGSLDSMNKFSTSEDGDLVAAITKIFDEKKKEFSLSGEDLPFVDESPEKAYKPFPSSLAKNPSIPNSPILYRNPSLHKTLYGTKLSQPSKETNDLPEKDIDSTIGTPDNERFLATTNINNNNNNNKKIVTLNLHSGTANGKLKRSESLNKPERTVSPLHNKLKRSESLNKPGERLKRSDSLTKTEKTESNISKRREMNHSARRTNKDTSTKLKRKNGMPERSIKRRHTVGGTKDPDKINYLDNSQHEKMSDNKENAEKKNLRTSSPDLSGTRRPNSEQRLLLEVSVMGPDVVVALRQHLIGPRPVSFPETVFSVPLESHV